jgi:hypothetical protein
MLSLVVKHNFILVLFVMVALFDLKLKQLDINITFLYGELDERIYNLKDKFNGEFEIKDLGATKKVLGWRYVCSAF